MASTFFFTAQRLLRWSDCKSSCPEVEIQGAWNPSSHNRESSCLLCSIKQILPLKKDGKVLAPGGCQAFRNLCNWCRRKWPHRGKTSCLYCEFQGHEWRERKTRQSTTHQALCQPCYQHCPAALQQQYLFCSWWNWGSEPKVTSSQAAKPGYKSRSPHPWPLPWLKVLYHQNRDPSVSPVTHRMKRSLRVPAKPQNPTSHSIHSFKIH